MIVVSAHVIKSRTCVIQHDYDISVLSEQQVPCYVYGKSTESNDTKKKQKERWTEGKLGRGRNNLGKETKLEEKEI